jgi:hypothetical protein
MTHANLSTKDKRKGIFYLILPLILIPFLLLFGNLFFPAKAFETASISGLNHQIPEPILEDAPESKSAAYSFLAKKKEIAKEGDWTLPTLISGGKEAESSSIFQSERFKSDHLDVEPKFESTFSGSRLESPGTMNYGKVSSKPQDEALKGKMLVLEKLIADQEKSSVSPTSQAINTNASTSNSNPEIERLQQMMDAFQTKPVQKDPEIEQLDQLIGKLLDLQNPERIHQKSELSFPENDNQLFSQQLHAEEMTSEFESWAGNGFYGLEAIKTSNRGLAGRSFRAVISENQEIFPGQVLQLQLKEDMVAGKLTIPAGSILHANTQISGDRLLLKISGIFWDDIFYGLKLEGFGMDAIAGLPLTEVKGGSQILDQGQNQALNLNIGGLGMGMEAQLANAGLNAGRSMMRNKSKAAKLSIKAGHPVILLDFSSK